MLRPALTEEGSYDSEGKLTGFKTKLQFWAKALENVAEVAEPWLWCCKFEARDDGFQLVPVCTGRIVQNVAFQNADTVNVCL